MSERVVVVTGGGNGIGAAVAEELGRQGALVVTVDPQVALDGTQPDAAPTQTTADRIVAAGGKARASNASVTDADAVRSLFRDLVDEFGRLDAVVNVAGISRPTSFTRGTEEDWRAVIDVHLNGYRNVLAAALPLMAEAGYGRVLGVTSGSGWRAADTGAYGCAKRAVAALTWQIGRFAPDGVVVNAMSPIAVTRMVTAALGRAPAAAQSGGSTATGGLSLGSMPQPEAIGPLGAWLVRDEFDWCTGEVVFAGGPEAAVVEPPRLLEVVDVGGAKSLPHLLEAVTPALVAAEQSQVSGGGSNPRFGDAFDEPGEAVSTSIGTCAVASDHLETAGAVTSQLEARGVACTTIPCDAAAIPPDVDAVVVARAAGTVARDGWQGVLAEHDELADAIYEDARWARLAADAGRPIRLVTLVDATTSGGRSRAQAAAQHTRSARKATKDAVSAFAVSVEGHDVVLAAALAAHLVASPAADELSGAELVAGDGWFGLRSHPRPGTSFTFADAAVPEWFDDRLREARR